MNPQVPKCFGSNLWSSTAAECVGGADPSYTNPQNGTNVRNQCRWYASCAARNTVTQRPAVPVAAPPTQLVPANRLVTSPPPVVPIQAAPGAPVQIVKPPPVHPYYQQPAQPYYQQPQPQFHQYPHAPPVQMAPHYQAYYGAPLVPMPMQQPGMQVHGYLSIPEPVRDDVNWFPRLVMNAIRAMFKAAMHETSHFVDHNTFSRPQPAQPQVFNVNPPT